MRNNSNWTQQILPFNPFHLSFSVVQTFGARVMQRHWYDSMMYDNDYICDQILPKIAGNKSNEEAIEIAVYPNPANNSFKIQSNVNGLVSIKDMTGRKIFEATFSSPLKEINVSGILPGVYFLTLEVNNTIVANKQIVLIK